jgi:probable F420-dependent oxidoreductase
MGEASSGIGFWHTTAWMEPTLLPHLARACEEAGFAGMLVHDHVVFPERIASAYPYSGDGDPHWAAATPWTDPWVAMAAMAAVTERIRFAQSIFIFPLRHPVEVAKSAGSVAALSGGRVAVGAGVGWMAEEFEILGEDFHTRGARTDEGIEVCRKLWSGEPVAHDGRFYSFPTVTMSPAVPGGHVPVWIGGHSDPALRRAARNDGWIGNAYPLDEAEAVLDRLEAALASEGRRLGDGFEVVLGLYSLDPDDFRRFAERGVTGFLAAPAMMRGDEDGRPTATLDERLRAIEAFGTTVVEPLTRTS